MKKTLLLICFILIPFVLNPQKRDFKKEIKQYREALKENPKNLELLFKLAQLLSWDGELDEAIKLYEKLIDDNPEHTDALLGLANVYSWKKDFEKSIQTYQKVIQVEPRYVDAYLGLVRVYFLQGDLENAKKYNEKALEIDPQNQGALLSLNKIKEIESKPPDFQVIEKFKSQNKFKEALVQLEKMHQDDLQNIDVMIELGRLYSWIQDYDKSFFYFNKVLEKDPENYEAQLGKARVYSWTNKTSQSIALLDKLLQKHPHNAEVLQVLGRVYGWSGKYEESIQAYQKILKKNPSDIEALKGLADTYLWGDKLSKAINTEEKILKLYPNEVDSMLRIGSIYARMGALDKALFWYEKASVAEPHRSDIHALLGMVYAYSSRMDEAAKELKKSIQLQEGNISNYVSLGRVYSWQANIEESKRLYEKALKVDPHNIEALNGYAQVHYFNGEWDRAIQIYEKSLRIKPENLEAKQGLENVRKAKAPLFVSRFNSFYTKDYDPRANILAYSFKYQTYQYSEEFTLNWAPHKLLELRYQNNRDKAEDLLNNVHYYDIGQNVVSLRGEYPLFKNAYVNGRLDWNDFYNKNSGATYTLSNRKQKWTGFLWGRYQKDRFAALLSASREPNAVTAIGSTTYVIDKLDLYGGALTYDVTEYLSLIGSYFYYDYNPISRQDRNNWHGVLEYRLPFFEKIVLNYEYDYITHALAKTHSGSIRFFDRLWQKLLFDLKVRYDFVDDHGNSGITKSYDLSGVLSYEITPYLYLTSDLNYNKQLGNDKNKLLNMRFYITGILDF